MVSACRPSFFRERARQPSEARTAQLIISYLPDDRITPPYHHTTATMTSTIGIPIKLLNEAQGHIVTLEIDSGTTYRGKLIEGARALPVLPPPREVPCFSPSVCRGRI